MSEFERLLNSLHAGGELDSEGVFTVDMGKAMEKMAQFALPHPALGVLKLIQSAVATGASKIEVTVSRSLLQVEHDGRPPLESDLKRLFSFLFQKPSEKNRALRDLAVAVNHSLGHQVAWAEVITPTYHQRWLAHHEVETPEPGQTQGYPVCVRIKKSLGKVVKDFLQTPLRGPWSKPTLSEESLILGHCRYGPCRIVFNEQPVSPEWHPFPVLLFITLPDSDRRQFLPHPGSKPFYIPARGIEDGRIIFGGESYIRPGLPQGALLASIGYLGEGGPLQVTFTQDGVDLEERVLAEVLTGPTTQARVVADGLPRDATDLRLVEGERLERRVTLLQRLTEELATHL